MIQFLKPSMEHFLEEPNEKFILKHLEKIFIKLLQDLPKKTGGIFELILEEFYKIIPVANY